MQTQDCNVHAPDAFHFQNQHGVAYLLKLSPTTLSTHMGASARPGFSIPIQLHN